MMRIIRQLAIKFQLGLSKRFEQLVDCVYMGGSVTSMYVPFTGSELDDDDDDDLRDKAFSLDDGVINYVHPLKDFVLLFCCSYVVMMKAIPYQATAPRSRRKIDR